MQGPRPGCSSSLAIFFTWRGEDYLFFFVCKLQFFFFGSTLTRKRSCKTIARLLKTVSNVLHDLTGLAITVALAVDKISEFCWKLFLCYLCVVFSFSVLYILITCIFLSSSLALSLSLLFSVFPSVSVWHHKYLNLIAADTTRVGQCGIFAAIKPLCVCAFDRRNLSGSPQISSYPAILERFLCSPPY